MTSSKRLGVLESQLSDNPYVRVERCGRIGVLRMLHYAPRPAVACALSAYMRGYLLRGLRELEQDAKIEAIVIAADSDGVFSRGLNLEDFADGLFDGDVAEGDNARLEVPSLSRLNLTIEACAKPTVAAIDGYCVSWAVEMAAAASFRLTTARASFRFSDVNYALVPCGGGALRVARLIGVRHTVSLLYQAPRVYADAAKGMGLVDEIVLPSKGNTFLSLVVARVTAWLDEAKPSPESSVPRKGSRIARRQEEQRRQFTNRFHSTVADRSFIAWAAHNVREKMPRRPTAPHRAIDMMLLVLRHRNNMAAFTEKEKQLFTRCVQGTECQGVQHVLRSSQRTVRAYEKLRGPVAGFSCVAIIGCGTLGTSIAVLFLLRHLRVLVVEMDPGRAKAGRENIIAYLTQEVSSRRLAQYRADEAVRNLEFVGSHYDPFPSVLAEADLVVECAPEVLSVKQKIFHHLDHVCKPQCVLASGSSTQDVDALATVCARPERVVGFLFYAPANQTPLIEVIRGARTSPEVMRRVMATMEFLNKYVVVSRSSPGFVGTRLFLAGLYQAYSMIEDGAHPIEVDRALRRYAHMTRGVLQTEDVMGLDVTAFARRALLAHNDRVHTFPPRDNFTIVDELVKEGHCGCKARQGWFRYSLNLSRAPAVHRASDAEGRHQPLLSVNDYDMRPNRGPELKALACSKRKNIHRRDFEEREIEERVFFAMVNEAAKLLGEGVAACASDIDITSVFGFGFPIWRGGLLYWADHHYGARKIVTAMKVIFRALGADNFPEPCATLLEMAERGQTFAERFPGTSSQAV